MLAGSTLAAINDRESCRATAAAPRRVLASQAAAGTSPALAPPPRNIHGLRQPGGDHVQRCAAAVQAFVIAQQHESQQQRATVAIPNLLDWAWATHTPGPVSYTHLRAHETGRN